MQGINVESEQGSSISNAPVLNFNVPRRAHYGQPLPLVQENVANNLVPLIMYIDTTEFARTIAIMMAKKDKKKYERPGDVIEHAEKCGAYDFYGTLDTGQANK